MIETWRSGGARAGRARVVLTTLVEVTSHPQLSLLPVLGSDLLPELSSLISGGDGEVESSHAHRSLEQELYHAWRNSSALDLGNSVPQRFAVSSVSPPCWAFTSPDRSLSSCL